MTPAPNDLSLTFNLPTLSAAEPKKKKPEAASEPPQKVSAPSEARVKDPQPRVEESPTVKKPETQQIPPSPPLPTDDDSASKVKGKSPNEKYNLSIDQDLIPRIRWAVQKETGYVYKQGYIYLVAVKEVPLKDIERYLDAYSRNLSTVPELPKVTVRLGNRHAVPAAPASPRKKLLM